MRTRTEKRRQALLQYKRKAAIGIPPTSRSGTSMTKQNTKTHVIVWVRDPTCRYCLGSRHPDRGQDQMHHDPPLSNTRGLPPEQRSNSRVCGRACVVCHEELTGTIGKHKLGTEFLIPEKGFDGPIRPVWIDKSWQGKSGLKRAIGAEKKS